MIAGRPGEAAKLLGEVADIPSAQLKLLRAILLKRAGQEREALDGFLDSRIALSDSSAMAAFASGEEELRWQVVRLYARLNQPRAALKLANVDERLRGAATVGAVETGSTAAGGLLTLSALAAERQNRSRMELLALLSASAEAIGEFDKAADFERARVAVGER